MFYAARMTQLSVKRFLSVTEVTKYITKYIFLEKLYSQQEKGEAERLLLPPDVLTTPE